MLIAVFAIPRLIHSLGPARFGVLTIVWMVVGYFSFFDFGLGRALTKLVADKLGAERENELPQLVWTAIGAIFLLGTVGTIVLLSCAHLLVYTILKVPEAIRPETLRSFYALAFAIPIVTTSSGLRGILEAHQEFALLMAIRVPLGMFTFAGPLFVFIFSRSMVAVVGALLAARLITCIAHLLACLLKMPELRHRAPFRSGLFGGRVPFGWLDDNQQPHQPSTGLHGPLSDRSLGVGHGRCLLRDSLRNDQQTACSSPRHDGALVPSLRCELHTAGSRAQ